jgi:hypothetical protein
MNACYTCGKITVAFDCKVSFGGLQRILLKLTHEGDYEYPELLLCESGVGKFEVQSSIRRSSSPITWGESKPNRGIKSASLPVCLVYLGKRLGQWVDDENVASIPF